MAAWRSYKREPINWRRTGGTAGFTRMEWDIEGFFDRSSSWNSLPLGVHKPAGSNGIFWSTIERQGHGLCFAPNGTGKGTSVIVPALLTYAGSTFVIDPKGENAWITAPRRREIGQRVVILDPWDETNKFGGVTNVERPTRFNPLRFLDRKSRNFADDIATVADALIISNANESSPHWANSAREYLGGLIALVKEAYGDNGTLRHVRNLLTGNPDKVFELAAAVERKLPESLAVRKLLRFAVKNDEISGIISSALTQTAFLDSPDLLDAMENDDPVFDLNEFTSQPTTLYVVLPPDRLITHARWLRLILSLTLRAITKAKTAPATPTLMLIDEMGTIGALRPLEAGYGLLRGYGVRFFGFLQSLPQLQGDYPKTWRNFIANCALLQVLGIGDMDTANEISQMLGTTSVHIPGPISSGGGHFTQRPVMFPQELMARLGKEPRHQELNEQLIMFLQGAHNTLALQNPYFKHPGWTGWYRVPPQFRRRQSQSNRKAQPSGIFSSIFGR